MNNKNQTNIEVQQGGFKSSPNGIDGSETPALPTELISRYWSIIKSPNHSPYFTSKKEENQSIVIKIKELQKIKTQ